MRHIKNDRYLFRDDSGEITVEIDDDELPREGIELNQRVRLLGEIDIDRNGNLEIEAVWLDRMAGD